MHHFSSVNSHFWLLKLFEEAVLYFTSDSVCNLQHPCSFSNLCTDQSTYTLPNDTQLRYNIAVVSIQFSLSPFIVYTIFLRTERNGGMNTRFRSNKRHHQVEEIIFQMDSFHGGLAVLLDLLTDQSEKILRGGIPDVVISSYKMQVQLNIVFFFQQQNVFLLSA